MCSQSQYLDNHWSLTKFCVSQFKSRTLNKLEQKRVRDRVVASKSFDGVKDIVGEWTGEQEMQEIIKAIQHREQVEATIQGLDEVDEYSTPIGTQNPEPPSSHAPLVGDSVRTVLPAMVTGEDPPTPTPVAIAV